MAARSQHAPALAGAASGAAQVLAEHPLDSLKVRLQSRLAAFNSIGGPIAMLRHTVSAEGAAALFQGLSPRLLTYSVVKLSLFSLYERWLPVCGGSPLAAGALAGACNTLVSCPQDVLKSRLQVLRFTEGQRCPSPAALAQQLVRAHGPLVFYRGWGALVVRDTFGYGLLFSVYSSERLRRRLPPWVVGGMSGLAFYLSTLPLDRAKTVLMTQDLARPAHASGWGAARAVVEAEGWLGLYRGCSVTLLRTFVGQAVGLTVYSSVLKRAQAERGR